MIKKSLSIIFLFAAVSIGAAQTPAPSPAATPRTAPAAPHTNLKVGDKAPDFTLPSTAVGPDGRGRWRR